MYWCSYNVGVVVELLKYGIINEIVYLDAIIAKKEKRWQKLAKIVFVMCI